VFYGDIPLMTENGTFIINGTERVNRFAVAPLAGRVFRERQQPQLLPRKDYSLPRILGGIRVRHQEHSLRSNRPQAQIPGSIFLRALGMKSNEDILRTFYQVERISLRDKDLFWNVFAGIVDRKLGPRNPQSEIG